MPTTRVQLKDFDNPYPVPQRLKIQDIELTDADKQCVMDLTPYMNLTPYTASIVRQHLACNLIVKKNCMCVG